MAPTASRPKDETLTSVRVAVRVRPFTDAELDAGSRSSLAMPKGPTGHRLSVSDVDTWTAEEFALDHCYGAEGVDGHVGPAATQERLYRDVGEPALDAAWAGYNVNSFFFFFIPRSFCFNCTCRVPRANKRSRSSGARRRAADEASPRASPRRSSGASTRSASRTTARRPAWR